ncbi:hypothetical protein C0J52_05711 [Blattella germanica]|nr:hypothetical protein C0J52_05711 [Blattella germanica]
MGPSREKNPWTREAILQLIREFKKRKFLYDSKCVFYHNRECRNKAYREIATAVSMVRPHTNALTVKYKINHLHRTFIRESKKKTPTNTYNGSWGFYKHLSFLEKYCRTPNTPNIYDRTTQEVRLTVHCYEFKIDVK